MIFTLKIITMMSRTLKRHDFAITNYNDDEQDTEKAIMLIRVLDHEVAYRAGFILMATILLSACMMVMIVLSINEKYWKVCMSV